MSSTTAWRWQVGGPVMETRSDQLSCDLRSGSMAWLARRVDGRIRFVPAQSGEAAVALQDAGINALDPESFVVMMDGQSCRKAVRSSPCFACGGLRRLEGDSAAAAAGATTHDLHLQRYRRQPPQVVW
jgi:hypothetical protein